MCFIIIIVVIIIIIIIIIDYKKHGSKHCPVLLPSFSTYVDNVS